MGSSEASAAPAAWSVVAVSRAGRISRSPAELCTLALASDVKLAAKFSGPGLGAEIFGCEFVSPRTHKPPETEKLEGEERFSAGPYIFTEDFFPWCAMQGW